MDHDGPLCILPQVSSKFYSQSWHVIWHQIDLSNISTLWHMTYWNEQTTWYLMFYSYIILSSFHAHVVFVDVLKTCVAIFVPSEIWGVVAPQLVNLKKLAQQRLGSLINHESLEVRCFGVHYYLPAINHGSMKNGCISNRIVTFFEKSCHVPLNHDYGRKSSWELMRIFSPLGDFDVSLKRAEHDVVDGSEMLLTSWGW